MDQPFSITCTTCKSRLKVRNSAAVGQVVPCPKCGGMVMIKPPEAALPPEVGNAATKPVEQQAAAANPHNTKDFDDVESILAGSVPAPVAAAPRSDRGAVTGESAPPAAAALAPAKTAQSAVPVAGGPHAAPRPPLDPSEVPTTADPSSVQPVRYGMWLAISILAGVGLAVAVVVVSTWLLRDGTHQLPIDRSLASSSSSPGTKTDSTGKPASETGRAEKTAVPPADATTSSEPPAEARSPDESKPPETTKGPAKASDPLDIVGPAPAGVKNAKSPPAIGDDPLGKFADLLRGSAENPLPAAEAPAATEKPRPEPPPEVVPARPAAPRPAARNVNVAARLADSLPGVEAAGVPLVDFLQTISELSTIPITLEPEGLAFFKISPSSPVHLKATNTTVGKALEEALRPLQLQHLVVDDQLVVTLAEPAGGVLINYPMDDLTMGSEQQAQQLAQLAMDLVDPAAWKEAEENGPSLTPGTGAFAVQAPNRTHARLFFLYQKLRVARGLPLKGKHDAALFRLQTRSAKAQKILDTPITLNYSQPTLLGAILHRLGETAGTGILVDWQALAQEGWNPDGEGTLVVEGKPLSEALDELLSPMNLAWRAVDEQTLQVTSLAALAKTPELEVHPAEDVAPDASDGDALLARLRGALAIPEGEASDFAIRFDPVSRSLLASLPQPQQREVERLLAEWATESKAAAK